MLPFRGPRTGVPALPEACLAPATAEAAAADAERTATRTHCSTAFAARSSNMPVFGPLPLPPAPVRAAAARWLSEASSSPAWARDGDSTMPMPLPLDGEWDKRPIRAVSAPMTLMLGMLSASGTIDGKCRVAKALRTSRSGPGSAGRRCEGPDERDDAVSVPTPPGRRIHLGMDDCEWRLPSRCALSIDGPMRLDTRVRVGVPVPLPADIPGLAGLPASDEGPSSDCRGDESVVDVLPVLPTRRRRRGGKKPMARLDTRPISTGRGKPSSVTHLTCVQG